VHKYSSIRSSADRTAAGAGREAQRIVLQQGAAVFEKVQGQVLNR